MAHRNCVSCFKPEPAITRIRFSYDDTAYVLDVCSEHESRFESDMLRWVRLADTETRPTRPALALVEPAVSRFQEAKADLPRNHIHVPFPVTQAGEERHDEDPGKCPPEEVATWTYPGADRFDDESGEKYTARVLMQPRR